MSMQPTIEPLTDEPRHVLANALLASADSRIWSSSAGGIAVGGSIGSVPLGVMIGPPDAFALSALSASLPPACYFLADAAYRNEVQAHLSGWTRSEAVLWSGAVSKASPQGICPGWSIEPVAPSSFRPADGWEHGDKEFFSAMAVTGSLWALCCEGMQVSYLCITARTAAYADISIDTHPHFRRRGMARQLCRAVLSSLCTTGYRVVWGAETHNTASSALAEALGLVPVDRVDVWRNGGAGRRPGLSSQMNQA